MDNIFIAIGGSGTKVAEALVRLLALGCPTRRDSQDNLLTSAGHRLVIWRIDPDASAGANDDLQTCVSAYRQLHTRLNADWSMEIDEILYSNPLELLRQNPDQNKTPSLEGILADQGNDDADKFLELFYDSEELKIELNRGFYQKPFMGSAVMALFAESLARSQSAGRAVIDLNNLKEQSTKFFLCGSLHGGTGACGIPVMGKFLSTLRREDTDSKWKIAAGLLAPYCLPPAPPFKLEQGEEFSEELIDKYLKRFDNAHPERGCRAIHSLGTEEQKKQLVRQILLGFYADPEDVPARARQSLLYYKEQIVPRQYFDEMYLVGKQQPDQLPEWSNGGSTQSNPLNSAEVVAAIAALNFFSGSQVRGTNGIYNLAASTTLADEDPQTLSLTQLPRYQIGTEDIHVERVLLATAILCHFLRREIPWEVAARHWSGLEILRGRYRQNARVQQDDHTAYLDDIETLESIALPLITGRVLGWEPNLAGSVRSLMGGEGLATDMQPRGNTDDGAQAPISFGHSSASVSTYEMGRWAPVDAGFSRGKYMRTLWSNLYKSQ